MSLSISQKRRSKYILPPTKVRKRRQFVLQQLKTRKSQCSSSKDTMIATNAVSNCLSWDTRRWKRRKPWNAESWEKLDTATADIKTRRPQCHRRFSAFNSPRRKGENICTHEPPNSLYKNFMELFFQQGRLEGHEIIA